jgi:hypothetical protein
MPSGGLLSERLRGNGQRLCKQTRAKFNTRPKVTTFAVSSFKQLWDDVALLLFILATKRNGTQKYYFWHAQRLCIKDSMHNGIDFGIILIFSCKHEKSHEKPQSRQKVIELRSESEAYRI